MIEVKTHDYKIVLKDVSDANLEKCNTIYSDDYKYKISSCINIEVTDNLVSRNVSIAARNGATSLHERSFKIEDDTLIVCCSNYVFCLSLPLLNILWKTEVDPITCFGLYKKGDIFIVHGELLISRFDKNGKILWYNLGDDIFTTMEGIDDFKITDTHIFAMTWNYTTFKFDFDGNIVSVTPTL